jgi:hypothetical protein
MPARCAITALVRPMMPQPTTATRSGSAEAALATATSADPHESDQPLPPWP